MNTYRYYVADAGTSIYEPLDAPSFEEAARLIREKYPEGEIRGLYRLLGQELRRARSDAATLLTLRRHKG